jgi:hypothetical protein
MVREPLCIAWKAVHIREVEPAARGTRTSYRHIQSCIAVLSSVQPMSVRYYSKVPDSRTRKSSNEVVQGLIADQRRDYTSDEKTRHNRNRFEKWRKNRECQLVSELQSVRQKFDDGAENEEGSIARSKFVWTKQAVLINEVKIMDLHSKYCWRRNRLRFFVEKCSFWVKICTPLQPPKRQATEKLGTVKCYCRTARLRK